MVNQESELDVWCLERSIVSIQVSKNGGGKWLDMTELRSLYKWMSMDVSSVAPNATAEEKVELAKTAYIGQPVGVAEFATVQQSG